MVGLLVMAMVVVPVGFGALELRDKEQRLKMS